MKRLRKKFVFILLCFALSEEAKAQMPNSYDNEKGILRKLWISNFNHEKRSGKTGDWVHNMMDPDQNLKTEIVDLNAANGESGKAMRLDYDVDSLNPAMVGFWIRLENQDLSDFDTLHLSLKASDEEVFKGNVAVQFTDKEGRKSAYMLSRISQQWKEYRIPLNRFRKIRDWSGIKELEIIIDDINASPKEGSLYLDEIYVSHEREA